MKPYDPNVRYLGPQGHWLNKYIPEYPPGAPEELKELWNQAAFGHDVDFEGSEYAGFTGWVKKWLSRDQVKRDIRKANQKFRDRLIIAIEQTKHLMTIEERVIAFEYASIVFKAVENFGWAFYKVGG